ncbi:hypothetical protein [Olleya sp. HaHaR_3_96]|uniref:hypothetical protein n=1 Tax=Olleya sp. HaHaR_3_96 TaxID=2745560 RepID=UPI001C4FB6CA|nr:hypothetical protein [Olleya sp. HaHaR_3_96]QXP61626.1 hypothetical protein H0I26_08355 [Olleya sp. HaHaR_3_96]
MIFKKIIFKASQIKWIPKWMYLLGVFQYIKLLFGLKSKTPYLKLKLKGYDAKVYLRPKTSDF